MSAAAPLPGSRGAAPRGRLKRVTPDVGDPVYYNQVLEELRSVQDAGTAYFGSFVYEPRIVPANALLPSGAPIFQAEAGGSAARVFERLASASVGKEAAAVRFLLEPPASIRSLVVPSAQASADRAPPQRMPATAFKSPPVTGRPEELRPAVEALDFIERAREHYSGLGPDAWKEKLTAQLLQRASQHTNIDLTSTPFSEEEAMLVLVGRFMLGNCWTEVARFLPGRTGKMVKGFWHSKLRPRYHRYGWAGRELSPPPELHRSLQQRPGSAAADGLRAGGSEEGGEESEDEEPREETREETNHEALAREYALMQVGLASRDPVAVLRAYHLQYARLQPGLEEHSTQHSEWEERCFLCKDGGELLCCQAGHQQGAGDREPCWKVYHAQCLGAKVPHGEAACWHCPRHACTSDRCPEPVHSQCATCPTSYCAAHSPREDAKTSTAGGKLRITCERCLRVKGDPVQDAETGGSPRESVSAAAERKRRQRQREKDEAKRLEMERQRQRERRERDRRKREEEAERDVAEEGEQPAWVQLLYGIKHMPTNNGGPILTRIEKAMALARGSVHPAVVQQLQLAISAGVYKSNSAGNTRHQALAAVDLHKWYEAQEQEGRDNIGRDVPET